jgi:hypothetical protein
MKGGVFLNVVFAEGASILKLLSSNEQTPLVGNGCILVLDLGFDVVYYVGWLRIQGVGLTSESLDKDLNTATETKDQMKGQLLLDVVVAEGCSCCGFLGLISAYQF